MPHPRPKGRIIPARPTERATRQFLMNMWRSVSRATRKRKRMRPRLATRLRMGRLASGKMAALKPGICAMTEGPRMMPPMTSAMTRG
jgi:hypothetical protein